MITFLWILLIVYALITLLLMGLAVIEHFNSICQEERAEASLMFRQAWKWPLVVVLAVVDTVLEYDRQTSKTRDGSD